MTNNVDALLDLAFAAFNENDLRRAEALCREAMVLDAHHGDALYLLGLIAYRQKAYSVANDLLHEAVAFYPKVQHYQLALAELMRAMGRFNEALELYEKWTDNPKVRTEAGLIYLEAGDKEKAKEYFQIALKSDEHIATAYLGLAALLDSPKEKESFLLKAFAAEESENTAYHLARFYVGKKEWEKAETILKTYLLFSRDFVLYAAILEGLKRTDEAMEALQKAIELDAFNSGAWVQQGLLLEARKDWAEAEISYRKALDIDDSLIEAREGLTNALVALNQIPLALEQTRKIIQKDPNHLPSLYKLAILLEQTEDYEEALGLYFKLLVLKADRVGLEKRIQESILALSKKKKRLAKKFAKGWMKSFPESAFAKKTWDLLKVILLVLCLGLPSVGSAFLDETQASLAWEARHAEMGDAESQYNVAKMWEEGKHMPRDTDKAVFYYKKSAAQGYMASAMALGRIWAQRENMEKALSYYEQAANQEYVPAQLWLGRYYQEKEDYAQAQKWLERAYRQLFPNEADLTRVAPELKELQALLNAQKEPDDEA